MCGIEITRGEFTASDLRMAAGQSRDARAARRMLALALVLEGVDRTRAAQTCGMDRQTLRFGGSGKRPVDGFPDERVHRCNAEGLAGGRRTAAKACGFRVWRLHRWRTPLPGSRPGRTQRRTGRSTGDGRISSTGLPGRSGSRCMSAQSARIWRRLGIAGCRFARSIPGPIPARRKASKKTPRGRSGGDPRSRARQAPSKSGSRSSPWCRHRSGAHGGRACWSTGHAHPYPGQAKHQTPCARRYQPSMGVRRFS
jgi:hypothetical protein